MTCEIVREIQLIVYRCQPVLPPLLFAVGQLYGIGLILLVDHNAVVFVEVVTGHQHGIFGESCRMVGIAIFLDGGIPSATDSEEITRRPDVASRLTLGVLTVTHQEFNTQLQHNLVVAFAVFLTLTMDEQRIHRFKVQTGIVSQAYPWLHSQMVAHHKAVVTAASVYHFQETCFITRYQRQTSR